MEFEKYILRKKEFYDYFHKFIENDSELEYNQVIKYFQFPFTQENRENLKNLLQFLTKIANNHHHNPDFFDKIKKIIISIKSNIERQFSNLEIFNLFKSNKHILLFLIEIQLISIDEIILNYLFEIGDSIYTKYCHFFYPEIKHLIDNKTQQDIETDLQSLDPNIFTNFTENRQKGENHCYIANLIRNDSVEEFITYVTKEQIHLSSIISRSLFETNSILIQTDPTLIEYAAFYGSIQIFQYLLLNNVDLPPSLWIYVIHSRNAELIHILEENNVEPVDKSYEKVLKESIKCHHNEIADYIIDKYFLNENKLNEKLIDFSLRYFNFHFLPNQNIDYKLFLYYSYQHDHFELVNLLLKEKEYKINEKLQIQKKMNFFK